jgi:hypothetical protein
MSRLKATLVLVALVAFGAVVGLWIRGAGASRPLEPDATTTKPDRPASPDSPRSSAPGSPAAPSAQNSKSSLVVRLRCDGKPEAGMGFALTREETHESNKFTTGPDGAHAVLGLPAGVYHIAVDHPDFVPVAVLRKVEADRGHEVVLNLERGACLEGKVTDLSGRPLEDASIVMLNEKSQPAGPETRTQASGEYRVARIPSGTYDVRVSRTGYRRTTRPGVTFGNGGQILRLDIALTEGRTISGRVVADDGTPLLGATVIGNNEEVSTCRTDAQGNFALRELGDSPVLAWASASGYGVSRLNNLKPGATNVEFRLNKGAIVLGSVGADPMPANFNVNICLFEPEVGQFVPFLNRAGGGTQKEFQFNELPAGRYRLEINARGFRAESVPEFELSAGQIMTGVQIRLRKSP